MNTILFIHDHSAGDALKGLLEGENFAAIGVKGLEHGFREAQARRPQLVLVDLPLGAFISREMLRDDGGARTPLIVLGTAQDEEEKSRLLDQGADDYLAKPFSNRELMARIRAVLRRTSGGRASVARFGQVEVDLERRRVSRNGVEVRLSQVEYDLLVYFLRNSGRALTREQILAYVWGHQSANTRTLDMHVARLRAKLEVDVKAPRHILTIHGVGYRFLL